MQDIRKVMCWIFGCNCLLHLFVSLRGILYANHQHYTLAQLAQSAASFSIAVATIDGLAWWTLLKRRPEGRGWGIAASLASILIFLRANHFFSESVWYHHTGALFMGIVGLIVFLRRDEQHDSSKNTEESANYGSRGSSL